MRNAFVYNSPGEPLGGQTGPKPLRGGVCQRFSGKMHIGVEKCRCERADYVRCAASLALSAENLTFH